jgi:putative flippase GtrA
MKKPVKFILSGLLSNAVNWIFYFLMIMSSFPVSYSVATGYILGVTISYVLAKIYVFDTSKLDFWTYKTLGFMIVYMFGSILMVSLVSFLYNNIGLGPSVSWVLAAVPTAIFNYLGSKHFIEGNK